MERLFLGVYWSNRQETIRSAANMIYDILHALAEVDDRYKILQFSTEIDCWRA